MSENWLKVLALIFVFAAVILVVERLIGSVLRRHADQRTVNLRLQMIDRGMARSEAMSRLRRDVATPEGLPAVLVRPLAKLERMLMAAGVTMETGRLVTLFLLAPLVLFVVLAIVVGLSSGLNPGRILLLATVALALGFGLPMAILNIRATRRRKKMEEQFPVALDVFVRGLRAGHPIAAALDLLTVEMPDPIGSQFGIVVDEVTYGADLRDALEGMADRWDLDDIRMFVVSLSVQSETGGNLAEILENLAKVIRERHSMFLKVRALSSEGRMTSWMLTALPIVAFLLIFMSKPQFFLDVADDPWFIPGFGILLLLYAIGFYAIRKMIDLKV